MSNISDVTDYETEINHSVLTVDLQNMRYVKVKLTFIWPFLEFGCKRQTWSGTLVSILTFPQSGFLIAPNYLSNPDLERLTLKVKVKLVWPFFSSFAYMIQALMSILTFSMLGILQLLRLLMTLTILLFLEHKIRQGIQLFCVRHSSALYSCINGANISWHWFKHFYSVANLEVTLTYINWPLWLTL